MTVKEANHTQTMSSSQRRLSALRQPAAFASLAPVVPRWQRYGTAFRLVCVVLLYFFANSKVLTSLNCSDEARQDLEAYQAMPDFPCDGSFAQRMSFLLPRAGAIFRPLWHITLDNMLLSLSAHLLVTVGLTLVFFYPRVCKADSHLRMVWLSAVVGLPKFVMASFLLAKPATRLSAAACPWSANIPLTHLLASLYLPVCWQSQVVVSASNAASSILMIKVMAATGNWQKDTNPGSYALFLFMVHATAPLCSWLLTGRRRVAQSGSTKHINDTAVQHLQARVSSLTTSLPKSITSRLPRALIHQTPSAASDALKASTAAINQFLAKGGSRAQYRPAAGRYTHRLYTKISFAEPEQLPVDLLERLSAAAAAHGLTVTNMAVRRGCIELFLQLTSSASLSRNPSSSSSSSDELALESTADQPGNTRAAALAEQIVSVLGLEAPLGARISVSLEDGSGKSHCLSLSTLDGSTGWNCQPLPVPHSSELSTAPALPELVTVSPACLLAPSNCSSSTLQLQLTVQSDETSLPASEWTLVAMQHDRFLVVDDITPQSLAKPTSPAYTAAAPCATVTVYDCVLSGFQGDCDTVSLTLRSRDGHVGCSRHVLVVGPAQQHMCAELSRLQRAQLEQQQASGSSSTFRTAMSVQGADMLIHDLGSFLHYLSCWRRDNAAATAAAAASQVSIATKAPTPAWHLDPNVQSVMRDIRQDCLEAVAELGCVETAKQLLAPDLPPTVAVAAGLQSVHKLATAISAPQQISLLHRAVRSGNWSMVQVILSSGAGSWADTNMDGLTPLHLAAGVPDGGVLACSILEHCPEARALWRRGKPVSPAEVAAQLGAVVDFEAIVATARDQPQTPSVSKPPTWLERWRNARQLLRRFRDPAMERRYQQQAAISSFRQYMLVQLVQLTVFICFSSRIIGARDFQALWTTVLFHLGCLLTLVVALCNKDVYMRVRRPLWVFAAACRICSKAVNLGVGLPALGSMQTMLAVASIMSELVMQLPSHQVPLWLPLTAEALDMPMSVLCYTNVISPSRAVAWTNMTTMFAICAAKSALFVAMALGLELHGRSHFLRAAAAKSE